MKQSVKYRVKQDGSLCLVLHRIGDVRQSVKYGVKQDESLCLMLHRGESGDRV